MMKKLMILLCISLLLIISADSCSKVIYPTEKANPRVCHNIPSGYAGTKQKLKAHKKANSFIKWKKR